MNVSGLKTGLEWFESRALLHMLDSISTDGSVTFYVRDFHVDDDTCSQQIRMWLGELSGRKVQQQTYSDGSERWVADFADWSIVWNVIHPPQKPNIIKIAEVQL